MKFFNSRSVGSRRKFLAGAVSLLLLITALPAHAQTTIETPFGSGTVRPLGEEYQGLIRVKLDNIPAYISGPRLFGAGTRIRNVYNRPVPALQYGEIALYATPGLVGIGRKVRVQTPFGAGTARVLTSYYPNLIGIKLDSIPSYIESPQDWILAGSGVRVLENRPKPQILPDEIVYFGPVQRLN